MPGDCTRVTGPAPRDCPATSQAAWKSVETLLCKELGACRYEAALFAALPASTQSHLLEKWSLYKPKASHVRRELEAAYKACHGTESVPEEIAALAENRAAQAAEMKLGGAVSRAAASDALQQLPFAARLLVLWHAQRPEQILELAHMLLVNSGRSGDGGDLEHAENIVRARSESNRRCIAGLLRSKHRVMLQVEFQGQSTLVRLSDISRLPSMTFADACLGEGRLVKVKLPKPKFGREGDARYAGEGGAGGSKGKKAAAKRSVHSSYIQLAHHGFKFAGEQFDAFGSKDAHSLAWYFVRRKEDAFIPSAAAFRDVMGDWRAVPSASMLACRLELALGGVMLGPKLSDSQIEVVEDIIVATASNAGKRAAMTDGSGFISPDLAELISPRISQGQAASDKSEDKPAAFQIRLVCGLGCFKGTVVVNQALRGKVQLRRSMLKIPPLVDDEKATALQELDGYNRLLVVNTSREVRTDAELNKHLLLMLTACAQAKREERRTQLVSYFQELMHEAVERLSNVTHDRSAAYQYCAAAAAAAAAASQLAGNVSGMGLQSAMEMLLAGHALDQPYLASLLYKHLQADWDQLQGLRIECPGSGFLMGIPDPTGSLRPGEVYVRPRSSAAALVSHVVVARFPLVLPSSVKVFEAVESRQIEDCLGGRAGVIVFSCVATEEGESPVACMAGDYDGDLYYVNWNPQVVGCLGGGGEGTEGDNKKQINPAAEDATPLPSRPQFQFQFADDDSEGDEGEEDEDGIAFREEVTTTTAVIPLVQPVVDVTAAIASSSRKGATGEGGDVPLSSVYVRQLLSAPVREIPAGMVGSVLMHEWLEFLRTDMMGLSATQWLVHADRYGVHHPTTIAWARLHLQSLQARKHAVAVDRRNLPPQLERYPDFMGKAASASYPSTSIVGALHTVVQDRVPSLELDFGGDFKLDDDMYHPKARNYVQTLNGWVADYAQALGTIMSETSDEAERQARIEEVMAQYERARDDLIRDESKRRHMVATEVEEAVASALYEVCSLRFRDMLARQSSASMDRKTPSTASTDIASYFGPPRKPPVHYLRFCWRLCGPVLNRLKIRAQANSLQSVTESLQSLRLPLNDNTTANVQRREQDSDLVSISRRELMLLIQALQQQRR